MKKSKPSNFSAVGQWQRDAADFDAYFAGQVYSLGAVPTWTQVEEMRRTWCNARKTLREQQNRKVK